MSPTNQTSDRVLLVTGTSSGIGLETALAAAAAGWTTVATVRDTSRADDLRSRAEEAGVAIDVRALDVTEPTSIAALIEGVIDDHGRLDALVNNAGAAHVGTIETDDMDAFRGCMEVNFFGVVQMTQAAMPHLRAVGGRLLTVSSVGGVVGQPFNEAYCAAKFAVEGFMEALQPVAAAVGVPVSVVEPGAVASAFITNAGLDPQEMVADAGPYADVLGAYLARTAQQFSAAQPATEVATVILDLLAAASPAFRVQTSDGARAFVSAKLADLDGSRVRAVTESWVS